MTKEKAQTVLDCLRIMIPILEEAVGFEYKTPCCKDCKHWKPEAVDNNDKHWKELHVCGYWRRWYEKTSPCTRADDFCSKGEKKDD